MKLNKSRLHQTLRSMVASSTAKAGNKLMKELAATKVSMGKVLQYEADLALPELKQARQVELIQQRVLSSVSIGSFTVATPGRKAGDWSSETLTQFAQSESGIATSVRQAAQEFYREVIQCWSNTSGNLSTTFGSYYSRYSMGSSFPAIPDVKVSTYVYPLNHEKGLIGYNSDMFNLHTKAKDICKKVSELVCQADTLLQSMINATITCTTVEKFLELIPEAEKHLPEEVKLAKPTKQVADPKVINDIRAKLAAGLPV